MSGSRLRSVLLVAGLGLAAAGLVSGVIAHVRLRHPGNGNNLFWTAPGGIGIVVSSTGSDDIADGSHETALRNSIAAWNDVDSTTATLVEDTTPAQQARSDWASDTIHLMWFDESNSSGYFPGGSGTVAVTPIWFVSNGTITDADVLFNGSGFQFTTSDQPGRFDVQDVATHELGHLLGLDHSGCAGATMYPFVDTSVILHRSLSMDDVNGARAMYPSGVLGSITGTIQRLADSSPVHGAHVVALDSNGRLAAAALSESNGTFQVYGLQADDYTVYATPFEGPVSSGNLGGAYAGIVTDFESTIHGVVTVAAQQTVAIGNLLVGADVALELGSSTDVYPRRGIEGTTFAHLVRGTGLTVGSSLTASDPAVTVTPITWSGTQVLFDVTVPGGAAPGHVDLVVTNGGDTSILPAAIEITPSDPAVSMVSPATGDYGGGTAVTLTGTGFRAGARVVVGENIYVDGQPGGCTVVDPTTITLVTQATALGAHDVVVLDATGVEGRMSNGFAAVSLNPLIATVFPPAGDDAGGTVVVITGSNFVPGQSLVLIDNTLQSGVTVESATRITLTTDAGVAGGPYVLEVRNPGGGVATSAFTYAATPDPSVTAIDPDEGTVAGGQVVTITGANFTPTSTVWFGADPDTGLGGVEAQTVTWIDATTLEVTTPVHGSGPQAVLVQDSGNGQADVAVAGFTFLAAPVPKSGGGGGGCQARTAGSGSGRPLEDSLWVLLLAAWATWVARRGRRLAAARAERD